MSNIRRSLLVVAGVVLGLWAWASQTFAAANETQLVGRSVEGRPIECQIYGSGDDVLWIIATIHGNEGAGTPLVAQFVRWLRENPQELEGRKVVITPIANPDGFAAHQRFNVHGIDVNRNFPATNWGGEEPPPALVKPGEVPLTEKPPGETPLSEPESRALMAAFCLHFPDRVVSIHQPLDCLDYDGPADALAAAMGAKCRLPVKKLGSRPGSLGSFVGVTMGKPIITMELPEEAGMDGEQLWKEYGQALIAALRHRQESERTAQPAAPAP